MTLTARQQQVLDAIRDYRNAHGYGPSLRDVMEPMGISSPNGIMCHLKALQKKGAIEWDRNTARSLRVKDEGCQVVLSFKPDVHARLTKIANAKNLSVSALCQKVLLKALENAK